MENINVSTPNDGLGDPLRNAFIKVNDNFTELTEGKVDKIPGMGLSQLNYTTADKAKVDSAVQLPELEKREFRSTGMISTAWLSINADPTKYDISAGKGVITNYDDPNNPIVTFINIPAIAGRIPVNILVNNVTYIGIDSLGAIIESEVPFTPEQRRRIISIGHVNHANFSTINSVVTEPVPSILPTNQLHDLMQAIGPLNLSGNKFTSHAANLQLRKSSGRVFKLGINPTEFDEPHQLSLLALNAPNFNYRLYDGTQYASVDSINPNKWDYNGDLTDVDAGKYTVQTIGLFTDNTVRIQYGRSQFNSLGDAKRAIQNKTILIERDIQNNAVVKCFLIIKQGTTLLAEAEFVYDNIGNSNVSVSINKTSELINDGETGESKYVTFNDLDIDNGDKILFNNGSISGGGNIIYNAGWIWRINDEEFSNDVQNILDIAPTSEGMSRLDIVVAEANDSFSIIQGEESDSTPVTPDQPANTILVNILLVNDDGFVVDEGTIAGLIPKIERLDLSVVSNGEDNGNIAVTTFFDDRSSIRLSGRAVRGLRSIDVNDYNLVYEGKRLIIKNFGVSNVTLYNNDYTLNTGRFKFSFPNDEDFVLKRGHICEFSFKFTDAFMTIDGEDQIAGVYEYIGQLTPSLQEVIDVNQLADRIELRNQSSLKVGSPTGDIYDMHVNNDGSILLVGDFRYYNDIEVNGIVKLDSSGNVDTNFVYGTGFYGLIYPGYSRVSGPGKIHKVVGGYVLSSSTVSNNMNGYNGEPKHSIVKIDEQGNFLSGIDIIASGTNLSKAYIDIYKGFIYITGNIGSYLSTTFPSSTTKIIRIDEVTGALDGTFGTLGYVEPNSGSSAGPILWNSGFLYNVTYNKVFKIDFLGTIVEEYTNEYNNSQPKLVSGSDGLPYFLSSKPGPYPQENVVCRIKTGGITEYVLPSNLNMYGTNITQVGDWIYVIKNGGGSDSFPSLVYRLSLDGVIDEDFKMTYPGLTFPSYPSHVIVVTRNYIALYCSDGKLRFFSLEGSFQNEGAFIFKDGIATYEIPTDFEDLLPNELVVKKHFKAQAIESIPLENGSAIGIIGINRDLADVGYNSINLGNSPGGISKTPGYVSFTVGASNESLGAFSTTIGVGNKASTYGEVVLGLNASDISGSESSIDIVDPAFRVGVGSGSSDRKDGLRVIKSGLVTAPSITNALIDADSTGKSLVSKEYLTSSIPLGYTGISPIGEKGISTRYINLQSGVTSTTTAGGTFFQLFNNRDLSTIPTNTAIQLFSIKSQAGVRAVSINVRTNGSMELVSTGGGFLTSNTALGSFALTDNTTGNGNTAVGQQALRLNTIGIRNSAFGRLAGDNNLSGGNNSWFGNGAGIGNVLASYNSIFGSDIFPSSTIDFGNNNTLLGARITGTNTEKGLSNKVIVADGEGNRVIDAIGTGTDGVKLKGKYAITSVNGSAPDATGNLVLTAPILGSIFDNQLAIKLNPSDNDEIVILDSITGEAATVKYSDFIKELVASAKLDFPSVAASSSSDLTISVPGAVLGDVVSLGTPIPPAGCMYSAFVSAADVVSVRLLNVTSSAVDPSSATFKVKVLK